MWEWSKHGISTWEHINFYGHVQDLEPLALKVDHFGSIKFPYLDRLGWRENNLRTPHRVQSNLWVSYINRLDLPKTDAQEYPWPMVVAEFYDSHRSQSTKFRDYHTATRPSDVWFCKPETERARVPTDWMTDHHHEVSIKHILKGPKYRKWVGLLQTNKDKIFVPGTLNSGPYPCEFATKNESLCGIQKKGFNPQTICNHVTIICVKAKAV